MAAVISFLPRPLFHASGKILPRRGDKILLSLSSTPESRKTFIIPHQKHDIPQSSSEIDTLLEQPSIIAVVKAEMFPDITA